jgi:hypothetical protein
MVMKVEICPSVISLLKNPLRMQDQIRVRLNLKEDMPSNNLDWFSQKA